MAGEYPKMLYRKGAMIEHEGQGLDWLIVIDEDEEAAALKDGWRAHLDPLDHDGDGRKGGSRKPRTPVGRAR